MARPRAINEDNWYDIFSDWDLEDQAAAIRVLQQIHRQLSRAMEPEPTPKPKNGGTDPAKEAAPSKEFQQEAAQAILKDMAAGAED
jgi:hypothetical protein